MLVTAVFLRQKVLEGIREKQHSSHRRRQDEIGMQARDAMQITSKMNNIANNVNSNLPVIPLNCICFKIVTTQIRDFVTKQRIPAKRMSIVAQIRVKKRRIRNPFPTRHPLTFYEPYRFAIGLKYVVSGL
jgi:hypothetical protein